MALCDYNQTSVVRLKSFWFVILEMKRKKHWPKIEYHAKYIKESLISYTRKAEVQVVQQNNQDMHYTVAKVKQISFVILEQ